jgi:hypothetical protein
VSVLYSVFSGHTVLLQEVRSLFTCELQGVHAGEPGREENVEDSHGMQVVLPTPLWYVPGRQLEHSESNPLILLAVPREHEEQDAAPINEYEPGLHFTH